MLTLIPEKVNFEVSTTDLLVKYTERNETYVELDVLTIENYIKREKYDPMQISFNTVAELKCCSLNFYDLFYNRHELINANNGENELEFWEENGYHPNSGFYQVVNSSWLEESREKYDPQHNLGLKHFLIVGNDSYVELLARDYAVE